MHQDLIVTEFNSLFDVKLKLKQRRIREEWGRGKLSDRRFSIDPGVYIFLKTWKTSPPPSREILKSFPIFADFFVAPRKKFQVFTSFSDDLFPFSMLFLPHLLFLSLFFCFSYLFFNLYLFFYTFSCEFSPSWKASPTLKNSPPPGGGLFQENIRPCIDQIHCYKKIKKIHMYLTLSCSFM